VAWRGASQHLCWRENFAVQILRGLALVSSLALSGCYHDYFCPATSCGGPQRLYPIEQDLAPIAMYNDFGDVLDRYNAANSVDTKKAIRNEFIFERMYAMDVNYTIYEERLTKETEDEGFYAAVTNAALTGTGALIPVAQTTRLLSGIAAGLTTADQAYNKQYLYNKAVQVLQSQMRAKRADVASLIAVRVDYAATKYPLGMAMSDLEEYYRAGTLASAFIDLSEKVSTEATNNKKAKDILKGGGAQVAATQTAVSGGASAAGTKVPQGPATTPAVTTRGNFAVDAAGTALTNYIYPKGIAGGRDLIRAKQISDFIQKQHITASITTFLSDQQYAADRATLAHQLNLSF
jgi:hypothetical protein